MRSVVRELIETVVLALLIFLVMQFAVQNFKVEGSSMHPTVEAGEYVLVNKFVYFNITPKDSEVFSFLEMPELSETIFPVSSPKRGDVIIFRYPRDKSRDFVKRVIGLPGENVEIVEGKVFINGLLLKEPYVVQEDDSSMPLRNIGKDKFFVLGDNRRASNDSRDWGDVSTDDVIGKGWLRYWPIDRMKPL